MHYAPRSRRALLLALFCAATGAARAQNIGVGTLTPGEKLEVVGGNVKITTAGSSLIFPDGSTQTSAATGAGFIQNTTTQQTGNFSLSGSGTVGGSLTAGGTVTVDNANANTGTAANFLRFGSGGSGEGIGSKRSSGGNAYGLDFYTGYANRLSISNAGNVGIGTSSTTNGLVVGNTQTDSNPTTQQHNLQLEVRQGTGNKALTLGVLPNGAGMIQAKEVGVGYSPLLLNPVSGNVGVGTANPAQLLHVAGAVAPATPSTAALLRLGRPGNSGVRYANNLDLAVGTFGSTGNANALTQVDFRLSNANTDEPDMTALTLRSNGYVGIGTTAPGSDLEIRSTGATALNLTTTAGDPNGVLTINVPTTNTGCAGCTELIQFTRSGTGIGSITMNGTSNGVLYNTTSDKRLKERISPTRFGLADLLRIEVKDYHFIGQPTATRSTGFLAQDLFKIYPEAVKEGDYGTTVVNQWAVDYGKLTPLLVQAMQDQQKLIDQQQAELNALRAQNAALQTGSAADHASLLTLQAQMARLLGESPAATAQARK